MPPKPVGPSTQAKRNRKAREDKSRSGKEKEESKGNGNGNNTNASAGAVVSNEHRKNKLLLIPFQPSAQSHAGNEKNASDRNVGDGGGEGQNPKEKKKRGKAYDWEWTQEQKDWMGRQAESYLALEVPERLGFSKAKEEEMVTKWTFGNAGNAKQARLLYRWLHS